MLYLPSKTALNFGQIVMDIIAIMFNFWRMMNETFLISDFYESILIRSIGLTSNTNENDNF